jgi:hypothetical protein
MKVGDGAPGREKLDRNYYLGWLGSSLAKAVKRKMILVQDHFGRAILGALRNISARRDGLGGRGRE